MLRYARAVALAVAALLCWSAAALADFDQAQLAYEKGDYRQAAKLAEPLADQGSPLAQNLLGVLFERGQGVTASRTQAAVWFERAARQGNVMAQVNLARVILDERPQSAVNWLKKAAAKNYPPALTTLGMLYAEGRKAPLSSQKAFNYLEKAASYGYAPSQMALAELYLTSKTRPQPDRAYYWSVLALADKAISPEAARALEGLREKAAAGLSPQTIKNLDAKAASFKPRRWSDDGGSQKPKPGKKAESGFSMSTGTGFLVSRQGHLVTNSHVLAQCKSIKTVYKGQEYDLELLKNDSQKDLALLQLEPSPPAALKLRKTPVKPGESVVVTGFPGDAALKNKAKTTSGEARELAPSEAVPGRFFITAKVRHGNSGGPLLDASGNVIGVVTAMRDVDGAKRITGERPTDMGHAIDGETLRSFLAASHVPYAVTGSYSRKSADAIASSARDKIMPIFCIR